ncbi:MAG: diguanylate cyclase [Gammaproteobacteria bacterium]|nr:diguanylate cyclase [Gammaproteobacteria bacterium]
MNILLIDDTKTDQLIMKTYLSKMGHDVTLGENGLQAVELYKDIQPDLLIMDVIMPEMDGYEAAQKIRQINDEWIPIIFLSTRMDPEDIIRGIDSGGDDYLIKPINNRVLEAKMKAMQRISEMRHQLIEASAKLQAVNTELKQLVNVDGLTGLSNRRYLDELLDREIARAMRHHQPLTVILCDIDHFKAFNDHYGHLHGDDCLKQVGVVLKNICKRPTDLAARYGGEEFAVVLSDCGQKNAMRMAEILRQTVENQSITHEYSSTAQVVTMSLGVCTQVPVQGDTAEHLLKKADEALYRAKHAGRNQVKTNFKS